MSSSTADHEAFNTSHGKQINGKFYTYKELESTSLLSKLKDLAFYVILLGLVLFCVFCFYEVDYKKGTQKDVINKLSSISNYSMVELVNESISATHEFKKIIQATFEANSQRGVEIKKWVTNQTENFYTEIKSTIDGPQSFLDVVLHFPVYIKNKITAIYATYLAPIVNRIFYRSQKVTQIQQKDKVTVQTHEQFVNVSPVSKVTDIDEKVEGSHHKDTNQMIVVQ